MKYAKIKNGKIVDVINGLAPDDYVEVIQQWEAPTDYPLEFYVTSSNEPIVSVVDGEAHEHWGFILKTVDNIKLDIYEKQKTIRNNTEDLPIDFKGKKVKIKGDKSKTRIENLNGFGIGFKFGPNDWADFTPKDIKDLQDLLYNSTQAAFSTERIENGKVSAMKTHNELKIYLESM